jgi:20S proteasome alpha/beta subunit
MNRKNNYFDKLGGDTSPSSASRRHQMSQMRSVIGHACKSGTAIVITHRNQADELIAEKYTVKFFERGRIGVVDGDVIEFSRVEAVRS